MTGIFACFARVTIAAADFTSTASSTITLAPFVIACSACDCCFAGSWSALEYRTSQPEHSSSTRLMKFGRSCSS